MAEILQRDALEAAKAAYKEQINFGSAARTALDLATIVYQQRNPHVPASEARELIAGALGLEIA
ncbi:MAG: hypothetical protein OXT06_19845 [Rhodospirillaceae bacterium]|nr:hypothetical protein [Rhodospirillaceae bacterium]MDD9918312.1 hypothetical protein [Rhodospirillaceae bacterium]MDD9927936.1 hypothetical protein [Rhodospirillaceae bacterium]